MIGLFVTFLQLSHLAHRNTDDNIIMTWESYQLQDKFSFLNAIFTKAYAFLNLLLLQLWYHYYIVIHS